MMILVLTSSALQIVRLLVIHNTSTIASVPIITEQRICRVLDHDLTLRFL